MARWCEANRGEVAAVLSKGTGVPLPATRRAVDRADYVIGPMTAGVVAKQQRVADLERREDLRNKVIEAVASQPF